MDPQEVLDVINELESLLESSNYATDNNSDPELLTAIADYVEGVELGGTALEKLQAALQSAVVLPSTSLEYRMKVAGSRRAVSLLLRSMEERHILPNSTVSPS